MLHSAHCNNYRSPIIKTGTELLLRSLGTVLGTGLSSLGDAGCIQRAADDVVTGTGQILDTAAADHHDAVLLQVMSLAGNIACNLDAV